MIPSNETPSFPHALGAEKSVLSTLFQEPERLAECHGIARSSFYHPAHQIVFDTMQELVTCGKALELVSFVQHLIDNGTLESTGGAGAINELVGYAPTTRHLAQHCQELHEKHAERLLVLAGQAASRGDEAEHARFIQERDRIKQIANSRDTLLERLEALRYDPDTPPPPDEVCLTLLGRAAGSRGNITVIQAKQKAGKTGVISSDIAAVIRGNQQAQGDMLGFQWQGEATGGILHLDTEQSLADWHASVERARKRSGVSETRRLHSYSLVTFKIAERMEILRRKMKAMAEGGKIDCVIIDGIADLGLGVNNEEQAIDLVAELMRLAQQYDCLIIVVIHENPGTDGGKTRGHLGSELQRKAFANIRIDKDPETDVSTIYGTEMRKGSIPKAQGLCFAWDENEGMHVTLGIYSELAGQQKETAKTIKEREKWGEIYECAAEENGTNGVCPELSPEQAANIIRDINGTGKPPKTETIKKQMQRAETLGVLRKTKRGTWTMNTTGQTGQKRDNDVLS